MTHKENMNYKLRAAHSSYEDTVRSIIGNLSRARTVYVSQKVRLTVPEDTASVIVICKDLGINTDMIFKLGKLKAKGYIRRMKHVNYPTVVMAFNSYVSNTLGMFVEDIEVPAAWVEDDPPVYPIAHFGGMCNSRTLAVEVRPDHFRFGCNNIDRGTLDRLIDTENLPFGVFRLNTNGILNYANTYGTYEQLRELSRLQNKLNAEL